MIPDEDLSLRTILDYLSIYSVHIIKPEFRIQPVCQGKQGQHLWFGINQSCHE